MESTIIFRIGSDKLIEVIALGLAMFERIQLDPDEIKLNDQVIKWNRADAVALVSGSITEQQYIESNRIDQK
ncbi:MAG: hypothetical protein A2066_12865 [Bacteroidetes bacterium GWB2_41_8]|nr:MAG: hypothetical protein A2066_12865 [Bacteroidetes bacterium GWB2_41_8]